MYEPLNFDYESIHGEILTAVKGLNFSELDDGKISYKEIVFIFSKCALRIAVDDDSDQLEISIRSIAEFDEFIEAGFFSNFIGKRLGWSWVGRNYNNYLDSFSISFDGLEPELHFCSMASQVHIYNIVPLKTRHYNV